MSTSTKMGTGTIVGIVVAIIVLAIVIIIVVGFSYYTTTNTQNQSYCNDWRLQIEAQRSQLTSQWIQTPGEWAVFNQQVDDYNEECAA